MFFRIFDAFFLQNCICWILYATLTMIFDDLEEIIGKIIESRYIGICPIIDKIIDIGRRLPHIIGDFRELSAKLSISKMTRELSKIYCYRKKWLIAHPYTAHITCKYHHMTEHANIPRPPRFKSHSSFTSFLYVGGGQLSCAPQFLKEYYAQIIEVAHFNFSGNP